MAGSKSLSTHPSTGLYSNYGQLLTPRSLADSRRKILSSPLAVCILLTVHQTGTRGRSDLILRSSCRVRTIQQTCSSAYNLIIHFLSSALFCSAHTYIHVHAHTRTNTHRTGTRLRLSAFSVTHYRRDQDFVVRCCSFKRPNPAPAPPRDPIARLLHALAPNKAAFLATVLTAISILVSTIPHIHTSSHVAYSFAPSSESCWQSPCLI